MFENNERIYFCATIKYSCYRDEAIRKHQQLVLAPVCIKFDYLFKKEDLLYDSFGFVNVCIINTYLIEEQEKIMALCFVEKNSHPILSNKILNSNNIILNTEDFTRSELKIL